MNVLNIIDSIPFLASLPQADAEAILSNLQRRMIADGTVIVHESDVGDELFILLSGEIEVIKALGTDSERLLHVATQGAVLGEMSLIDPQATRSASLRVRGRTEVLALDRYGFEQIIRKYPAVSLNLLQTLSRRLRRSDNDTIKDLRRKNRELDLAYAELKAAQQRLVEQEVMANELRNASTIQTQMLPRELPRIPGVDISAEMIPARMVGGDLYDVIELEDGRLIVIVGDVAGKGIPAALYMALVTSLLRVAAKTGASPQEVLRTVNDHLYERDMDSMFVTLLYLVLDRQKETLTYVRAGHDAPLIWRTSGRQMSPGTPRSIALGLIDDPPLDCQTVALEPGTVIVAYTDGITEAMNESEEQFGHQRLDALLSAQEDRSAYALCTQIVKMVEAHMGESQQSDDLTVVALGIT